MQEHDTPSFDSLTFHVLAERDAQGQPFELILEEKSVFEGVITEIAERSGITPLYRARRLAWAAMSREVDAFSKHSR